MKVRDIMTRPAISVYASSTVEDTAKLMAQHNIGAIPVVQQNEIVGIVTDRDISIRSAAKGYDPTQIQVKDIMTDGVKVIDSSTDIREAANIMALDQIRRLPVVENEKLVGMIALGDIAASNDYTFECGEALSEISMECHRTCYHSR